MRSHLAKSLIALLLVAPYSAVASSGENPTIGNADGDDDDAFCRANNVMPGS